MVTVFDVQAGRFIKRLSEKLKGFPELKPPAYLAFVKSGSDKERAPEQQDFWYTRCASILRKLYINSPAGVGGLRVAYGGRKKRGVKSERHQDSGGGVIRRALQALEKLGFVAKAKGGGRVLTKKGVSFLDRVAGEARSP